VYQVLLWFSDLLHSFVPRDWPVSTGVVEGACGHLVKDHTERSGMHWMKSDAQAILELRVVRVNGDWDT